MRTSLTASGSKTYALQVLIVAAAIMGLLLLTGATVCAEDQVVTIYFAGTGATEQWSDASHSGFWTPELIATLYSNQKTSATHHKKFVNGIGTGCGFLFIDLFSSAFPDFELCRGWNTCLTEAENYLNGILQDPNNSGDVILNLVGFSRGGVSTMRFAHRVAANNRIKKINILAFDPAGHRNINMDTSVPADEFCLNDKVNQYIGVYASDERSYAFGPAIPDNSSDTTKVWMFRVPGSHETDIGNVQADGHSTTYTPGCGVLWLEECYDNNLLKVSWVSEVIAVQLLGSSQWGNVEFDWTWSDGLDYEQKKNLFVDEVKSMWQDYPSHYIPLMRQTSFLPFILPVVFEYYFAQQCHSADWFAWMIGGEGLYKAFRCASLFSCPITHMNIGLEMVVDPIDGQIAWDKLEELGNSPPTANAGTDQSVFAGAYCTASVTLDSSGSSDPDGDSLTYNWTGSFGAASGIMPAISLGLGVHTITLSVSDGKQTSTDTVSITVKDNTLPVPNASDLAIITGECSASITTAPAATDNCSGQITGTTSDPLSYSTQGTFTVTWIYDDGNGNTATQTQTVVVKDSTPPVIERLSASPNTLWPPNHRMVDVALTATVTDNCATVPICKILSVASNEPVNDLGDGDTAPDWMISGDLSVKLNAERSGKGNGRVYTLTTGCTDASGNSSSKAVTVTVSKDQGKKQ